MRRVIGMDLHRTFGEVVIWENGRLKREGRVEMTRTALEGFGRRLDKSDEVVIEATGNSMAVSRVLSPFVKRVVIANPLQVKAIASAHVKTDKIDAHSAPHQAQADVRANPVPAPLPVIFASSIGSAKISRLSTDRSPRAQWMPHRSIGC